MSKVFTLILCLNFLLYADELVVYVDADFSNYYTSSRSIELGIRTAVEYNTAKLQGHSIRVEVLDHHGNNRRSLKNLKTALANPNTLAVFCGMHSPPVLAHRDFINENKLLLLDPWAAAAPITRPKSDESYIFRLSVDDKTAGAFLVNAVIKQYNAKRPYLLLENTGWGKNNLLTLSQSLQNQKVSSAGVGWFNWQISKSVVSKLIQEIQDSGADSIILVGNADESAVILNQMALEGLSLPVISHWGITGGDFYKNLSAGAKDIPLKFIQTASSLSDKQNNPIIKQAQIKYAKAFTDGYLQSSAGFVHAYDLTALLITAGQEHLHRRGVGLRKAVKNSLENLPRKTEGLLKNYVKPFEKYSQLKPFSHEALNPTDYCLGFFNRKGEIEILAKSHE